MPSPSDQTSTAAPDLDPNSGLRASQPAGFRVGAVFGVPIYIHGTWLIIFMLITYSLATEDPAAPVVVAGAALGSASSPAFCSSRRWSSTN